MQGVHGLVRDWMVNSTCSVFVASNPLRCQHGREDLRLPRDLEPPVASVRGGIHLDLEIEMLFDDVKMDYDCYLRRRPRSRRLDIIKLVSYV